MPAHEVHRGQNQLLVALGALLLVEALGSGFQLSYLAFHFVDVLHVLGDFLIVLLDNFVLLLKPA